MWPAHSSTQVLVTAWERERVGGLRLTGRKSLEEVLIGVLTFSQGHSQHHRERSERISVLDCTFFPPTVLLLGLPGD